MTSIPLDIEQAKVLEEVGMDLLRQGDQRASHLLAIVLLWRSLSREHLAPDNVVHLDAYSRRVPCA